MEQTKSRNEANDSIYMILKRKMETSAAGLGLGGGECNQMLPQSFFRFLLQVMVAQQA